MQNFPLFSVGFVIKIGRSKYFLRAQNFKYLCVLLYLLGNQFKLFSNLLPTQPNLFCDNKLSVKFPRLARRLKLLFSQFRWRCKKHSSNVFPARSNSEKFRFLIIIIIKVYRTNFPLMHRKQGTAAHLVVRLCRKCWANILQQWNLQEMGHCIEWLKHVPRLKLNFTCL